MKKGREETIEFNGIGTPTFTAEHPQLQAPLPGAVTDAPSPRQAQTEVSLEHQREPETARPPAIRSEQQDPHYFVKTAATSPGYLVKDGDGTLYVMNTDASNPLARTAILQPLQLSQGVAPAAQMMGDDSPPPLPRAQSAPHHGNNGYRCFGWSQSVYGHMKGKDDSCLSTTQGGLFTLLSTVLCSGPTLGGEVAYEAKQRGLSTNQARFSGILAGEAGVAGETVAGCTIHPLLGAAICATQCPTAIFYPLLATGNAKEYQETHRATPYATVSSTSTVQPTGQDFGFTSIAPVQTPHRSVSPTPPPPTLQPVQLGSDLVLEMDSSPAGSPVHTQQHTARHPVFELVPLSPSGISQTALPPREVTSPSPDGETMWATRSRHQSGNLLDVRLRTPSPISREADSIEVGLEGSRPSSAHSSRAPSPTGSYRDAELNRSQDSQQLSVG